MKIQVGKLYQTSIGLPVLIISEGQAFRSHVFHGHNQELYHPNGMVYVSPLKELYGEHRDTSNDLIKEIRDNYLCNLFKP